MIGNDHGRIFRTLAFVNRRGVGRHQHVQFSKAVGDGSAVEVGVEVQYDARGIFLTYTCEDCHDCKMAAYRPDVLTDPGYWTDEPIDDD
jgi:hypothetical protein